MTGFEVVVAYLASWAIRKAGRVAKRVDTEVDRALDAGLDRLHELVVSKLGADPAMAQFEDEAARGIDNVRTQQRVQLAVEEAAERDGRFADRMRVVVAQLLVLEKQAGVSVTAQGIAVIGNRNNIATHGGVVAHIIHGSVTANTKNEYHPIPMLESTWPGRVLTAIGTALALVAFAGWMSIIFRAGASEGETGFGPTLPSGIPLAAFYFLGFGGGGVVAGIGASMATAANARRRWTVVRHALTGVIVIIAIFVAVEHVRGSVPFRYLLPHFASCAPSPAGHQSTGVTSITVDEWVCAK
jgi:hypothetical protein